jgi:hypothetical protein
MPLYGHHLFGSEFEAAVSDFGWRTGVTLWWAAWNQVPAASLPNDDIAITKLALLGRDVRAFRKIKAEALRGFVLCDDGRLYHDKLSVWALEAWARRVKERNRKAKWREAKDRDGDVPRTGTGRGQERGQDRSVDVPEDGTSPLKGSEVKGSEVELQKPSVGENLGNSTGVDNSPNGKLPADKSAKGNNGLKTIPSWHKDPAQVNIEAKRRGIERRPNESDGEFTDRVKHAVQHPVARA